MDDQSDPWMLTVDVISATHTHAVGVHPCPTDPNGRADWLASQAALLTSFGVKIAHTIGTDDMALKVRRRAAIQLLQDLITVDEDVAEMAVDVALRAQAHMPTEGKPH